MPTPLSAPAGRFAFASSSGTAATICLRIPSPPSAGFTVPRHSAVMTPSPAPSPSCSFVPPISIPRNMARTPSNQRNADDAGSKPADERRTRTKSIILILSSIRVASSASSAFGSLDSSIIIVIVVLLARLHRHEERGPHRRRNRTVHALHGFPDDLVEQEVVERVLLR